MKKFRVEEISRVAHLVVTELKLACEKIEVPVVARKEREFTNGEVRFTPRLESRRLGVFGQQKVDLAEEKINWLTRAGFWSPQLGKDGKAECWQLTGKKIAIHRETGIPIHLINTSK